jgi:Ca-activated chloride channel family protein
MMDRLFGITWAAPENALMFVIVAFLVLILILTIRRMREHIGRLVHADHQARLLKHFSWQRQKIKAVLIASALVMMGIALLRPQWDKVDEKAVHEGRDCIIALDISRSMLAQDYAPSRLAYAKLKIKNLINTLDAERIGLMIFSGAAVMQCPLTTDHEAFLMFLEALSVETISSGSTSYGAALQKILEVFSSFESERTKLAVLFTDGEDFSQKLTDIQQKLADARVRVCTFGIATEDGAPIPLYDEQGVQRGFQKDEQGKIVISRLNKALMQQIAHETGGRYVPVSHDESDIVAVKKWVDSFEKNKWEERRVDRMQDKYFYYTACAALLLLCEWLV